MEKIRVALERLKSTQDEVIQSQDEVIQSLERIYEAIEELKDQPLVGAVEQFMTVEDWKRYRKRFEGTKET